MPIDQKQAELGIKTAGGAAEDAETRRGETAEDDYEYEDEYE
jgi:hypothetical protein